MARLMVSALVIGTIHLKRRGQIMTKKMGTLENIPASCGLTRRQLLAASAGAILTSGVGAVADSVTAVMEAANNINAADKSRMKSDHSNTFYIMPLWESGLDVPKITDDQYRQQIAKMKKEFGPGNNYNKLGFASIYNAGNLPLLLRQLKVFQENNIHRGVIFAMQTHDGGLTNPNGDLRNYQWRLNGKTWCGMPGPVQGRGALV